MIYKIYRRIFNNIYNSVNRFKLRNEKDITILSNNCLAGFIYHDLKRQFLSPTINLFMSNDDFVTFCLNLKEFDTDNFEELHLGHNYPVAKLTALNNKTITIYFLHYKTYEEAISKWRERYKRINYDNIVILSEIKGPTKPIDFNEFLNLPYRMKIYCSKSIGIENDLRFIYLPFYNDDYVENNIFFPKKGLKCYRWAYSNNMINILVKKKICFVINDATQIGGIETVTYTLSQELSVKYSITVLSDKKDAQVSNKFEQAKARLIYRKHIHNKYLQVVEDLYFFKSNHFSKIIFQGFFTLPQFSAILFKRLHNVVYCEHGDPLTIYRDKQNFYIQTLTKDIIKETYIVSLTNSSMLYFRNIFKNNPIVCIPNPIKTVTSMPYNISSNIAVCISRLDPSKQIYKLVQSFGKYIVNKDWKIEIYGEGYEYSSISNYIKDNNLEAKIILKKYEENKEIMFSNKAIMIFPSNSEGFGMVAAESLSYKIPVVAFNINGLSDIIDNNKNGYLCAINDFDDLYEKTNYLMNNPNTRLTFSNNTSSVYQKFNIKDTVKKWNDLLS